MKPNSIALVLALIMSGVSLAGYTSRPQIKATDRGDVISFDAAVPRQFGEWTELAEQTAQVVNPQQREVLNQLYSQLVSRTYVNKAGYRIMLAVAYGDDQRGGLQAHRPEVCYPAQGFTLDHVEDGTLATSLGTIEVRRLRTALGERNEPVTYWLTVGGQVVKSKFEKRMAEFRLGLTGQIPDGLLFRVSSIDRNPARAFAMQGKFAADMMQAVPAPVRKRLGGPAGAGAEAG
jgi:EpsI family protein